MVKRSILFASKDNFGKLLQQKKMFITSVYALLAFQLGVIATTIYLLREHEDIQEKIHQYFWAWFVLTIVVVLCILFVPLPTWMKIILFTGLSVLLGMNNIAASKKISTEVVEQGILSTLSIFLMMTLLAIVLTFFGIQLTFMYYILMVGLLAMLLASILMIVFKTSSKVKKAFFFFGIVLFSLFIAYDTNSILQTNYNGDVVDGSLSLFLDIINLFTDLIGFDSID